ncbi:MAG: PQQ-binding-like beta-propeller repeat protein, partial [Terriglobales bacterium]
MTNPPKVSAVSRHVSLCGSILLLFASLSFGQAAIQLSKSVGPPTTKTLVSGEDFPANAEVNLYFDRVRVGQVTTDSTGSFSDAPIEVPKGALPGKHYVIAKAQTEAKARFLVRTNWPQYGFGPNGGRHNRFENVLNPHNVDKLTLRFSYAAPAGVGPPVVAEGMVYFGSNDGNVYALSADAGALVWKAEGSGPAVADGIVYFVGFYDTFLYARNAKTGALVWAYNIQISAFAPVVSDGVVYVTAATAAGYDLFALDARTGFLYWRDFIWATPDLGAAAIAKGTVYVGASGSSGSDLLAVSNGSVLWQYPIAVSSSPAVVNGVVYAGSADDNVYALDATTGSLRWKYSTAKSVYSSPATADGVIYAGSEDGNIYALNESTGALVWKRSIGYFATSPAVANGVVYVVSSNGNVYHLNALNAKTGVLLRKYVFKLEQPTDPVVANGIVYFGSGDGHLYAFGL